MVGLYLHLHYETNIPRFRTINSEKSGRKSHGLFQVLHYHFPEETEENYGSL
jgi:hypothetical protein